MKKIFQLIPWFLAVGDAWSIGCFYNVYYGGELSWLRRVYAKKVQMLNKIDAPQRLIFVGGSGVQYSIDSQEVEQRLGVPVFNFGLQGREILA